MQHHCRGVCRHLRVLRILIQKVCLQQAGDSKEVVEVGHKICASYPMRPAQLEAKHRSTSSVVKCEVACSCLMRMLACLVS